MKKKILTIISCSCLLLSLVGCGTKEVELEKEINDSPSIEIEKNEPKEPITKDNPNEVQMEKDLRNMDLMMPLMDSVMLCMFENDYTFDISNPDFVWNTMVYYTGNYLVREPNVVLSEDYSSLLLSKDEVMNYMKGYVQEIPELSETENVFLVTETDDGYSFGLGDRGLTETKMVSFSKNTDGSIDVDLRLVAMDDSSELCLANFHLEPAENSSFPMIIKTAILMQPQPKIQSGKILDIKETEVTLEIDGMPITYQMNENTTNQIKTKAVGGSVDVMIDKEAIINILN